MKLYFYEVNIKFLIIMKSNYIISGIKKGRNLILYIIYLI